MPTWLEHLENAKAEPSGIALLCKDAAAADSAKRQLYSARAKARTSGNKTFDSLSISMSPHSDEILYIYESQKKDNSDDSPQSIREGSEAGNDSAV